MKLYLEMRRRKIKDDSVTSDADTHTHIHTYTCHDQVFIGQVQLMLRVSNVNGEATTKSWNNWLEHIASSMCECARDKRIVKFY